MKNDLERPLGVQPDPNRADATLEQDVGHLRLVPWRVEGGRWFLRANLEIC